MREPDTIFELLKYACDRYGEKPCIKYADENDEVITKSYRDIFNDSLTAAYHITSMIPQKTHIAIISKTSYAFLNYYNAIFISGNTAVPFAPEIQAEELEQLLKKADVTAVVYAKELKDKISFLSDRYTLIEITPAPRDFEKTELNPELPENCALIMFTSGTTGDKKGVMLSSHALVSNVMFKEMSYEGNHVALNVLPMHHIFCFSCDYLKNLKDGVTICINGDIANIEKNLLRYEPTVIRLVPMIIEGLLKKEKMYKRLQPELTDREAAEKVFGRNLHSIIASGAYLNSEIAAEFEKMDIDIRQGYGMTETGPRIAVPNGKTSIYSAGAVIDICEVRIKDGEIQIKSPSLMTGYYKDEQATKEVFTDDGWFMTGDIGYMAEDRQLYITGRKKNLIILSNGENISPEEIEKKLSPVPAVAETLVYGENNKIVAEFYISEDYLKTNSLDEAKQLIENSVEEINKASASEKQIVKIKFRNTPFEKTSSGKIKRTQVKFQGVKQND